MDVIILGAGGHGKVVFDILRRANTHRAIGFLDADTSLLGVRVSGLPVLGSVNLLPRLRAQKVKGAIVAIGDNRARRSYARLVEEAGLQLISAIHPNASVSPTATIGRNVVIAAGAVVCPDARIADSVILNTACVVDHECEIGDAVHICPAAALAGRVHVEPGAFVGLGARVIQCVRIGENAVVGAGAVVLRDVPADTTVVGVPAKAIGRS